MLRSRDLDFWMPHDYTEEMMIEVFFQNCFQITQLNSLSLFQGRKRYGFIKRMDSNGTLVHSTLSLFKADTESEEFFRISFNLTRIVPETKHLMEKFTFLTLKQISSNETEKRPMVHYYLLSLDEEGHLTLRKIEFDPISKTQSTRWSLVNNEAHLNAFNSSSLFHVSLKMSRNFIELSVNRSLAARFELIDETLRSAQFDEMKFSSNFLNNNVSFMISDLQINGFNYEFENGEMLSIDTSNSAEPSRFRTNVFKNVLTFAGDQDQELIVENLNTKFCSFHQSELDR